MMKTYLGRASALAFALALAACGTADEPTNAVAAENAIDVAANNGSSAIAAMPMNEANAVDVDAGPIAAAPAPAPAPKAATVPKAAAPTPAKETATTTPKAAPKATPTAEPKPPAPTPVCLPEHRAMGHC
jgi:outer membrane biosynthesis protein TonB